MSAPRERRAVRLAHALRRTALYAGLALAALVFVYPFLWMAASTLKPPLEVGSLALIIGAVVALQRRIIGRAEAL